MKTPPKHKFKPIFENKRPKPIDPRFEDYAGHYNGELAAKSFQFIPELQKKEAMELKKSLKKKKITQQDRDILLNNYNKITNDLKAN
jgi:hypothetical protein